MNITVQEDQQQGRIYETDVVGYSIVSVVKTADGGLDVNRYFHVEDSWDDEDKQVAKDFLQKVEGKITELFPKDMAFESTLWVPDGY